MVGFYPLCAFGENRVAASIDTPLHAFLPFDHVDHLHPDWCIALAASANGEAEARGVQRRATAGSIAWVPWQRPGFELALMLRRAVDEQPGCDGILLGSHGLFTWGDDAAGLLRRTASGRSIRWASSSRIIARRVGPAALRRRQACPTTVDRESTAAALLPFLRGAVSSSRRVIAPLRPVGRRADVRRIRSGPPTCAGWARAVRITSCGRASARCSCRGIRSARIVAQLQQRIVDQIGALPRRVRRVLQLVRAGRFARAARLEPVGRRDSRRSASSASARTSARRGSRRSSSSTPFT